MIVLVLLNESKSFLLLKILFPLICTWEVLNRFDSEGAARVSGAAETVDYFG